MLKRFANYRRAYRGRGAARLDHSLWLHWALTGKYPALARLPEKDD